MEKRELATCPILKAVPEEPPPAPIQDPVLSEERRVTFNIGDADDADCREAKEAETNANNSESYWSCVSSVTSFGFQEMPKLIESKLCLINHQVYIV